MRSVGRDRNAIIFPGQNRPFRPPLYSAAFAVMVRAKYRRPPKPNRRKRPKECLHDPQPRPHPDDPCRQPAAQRDFVRPAGAPGGRREDRSRADGGGARQGSRPRHRQAGGRRHRCRQRRRAAAGRLPDLRAAAHGGFCRRVEAAARSRVRGVPGTGGVHAAAFPARQQAAERAGVPERAEISRRQAGAIRARARQAYRRIEVRRAVHDGALARHHFEHDARRLLRLAGQVPDRAVARDEAPNTRRSTRPG